jgi:hypothetical protein
MSFYIHGKRLPAKAEAAKLFLGALVFNDLVDSYTLTNLTGQVTRDNTHF